MTPNPVREFKPEYLSPTQINLYLKDKESYYQSYVLGVKNPSTPAMRLGSAFDYHVKRELASLGVYDEAAHASKLKELTGDDLRIGQEVLARYRACGALAALTAEVPAQAQLAMEADCLETCFGIPFKGLPDIYWLASGGLNVYDWKVSGYYSKNGIRPKKGWTSLWSMDGTRKQDLGYPLVSVNRDWAIQLTIYTWVLAKRLKLVKKEEELLTIPLSVGIDQLCHSPTPSGGVAMTVATYRWNISQEFRAWLRDICRVIWADLSTGFKTMIPQTKDLVDLSILD